MRSMSRVETTANFTGDFGLFCVFKKTWGPPRDVTGELYQLRLGLMFIVPKKILSGRE